jgi:hypothetical protein
VLGDWSEAANVYRQSLPLEGGNINTLSNAPVLSNYNNTDATEVTNPNSGIGQIGLNSTQWPVIQLYDLSIETFNVVYEQAGADEVVTLNYDSDDLDDYASMKLDRNSATQEAQVHLTITDNQLNIDPTAEDIVSFYVGTVNQGVSWMNKSATWTATDYKPYNNQFDDNGKLSIVNNTNGESILVSDTTVDDTSADQNIIFYESGENSGIFLNYDDSDDANLEIEKNAKRGFSATFDYNDAAQSLIVANANGVIDMEETSVGDVWNSGEALTVTLVDQDLNKNTLSNEDLVLANTTNSQLIPSLQIGSPLILDSTSADIVSVTDYSKIAFYTNATIVQSVGVESTPYIMDTGYTGKDLNAIDTVNTYFSYDVTSFTNGTTTDAIKQVCLSTAAGKDIVCGTGKSSIVEITAQGTTVAGTGATDKIWLNITKNQAYGSAQSLTAIPVIADVFSFGTENGVGVNNAIYRLLLEETGDNTATFVGSIEYEMLNQVNINSTATYTELSVIDQDVDIIIEQDMTDEDSPRVNYYDKGADGVKTQIADQVEAPTHNGVVSFDLDNYKIGDTVVVTLDDQDMNTDSELIDVYTASSTDSKVGNGSTSGLILDYI